MTSRVLRAEAVLIVVFWVAAALSPARQLAYAYGPQPRLTLVDSWSLAAFGWLGPVAGSFAWYANPMLALIVIRLLRGRQPGPRLPFVALGLAATVIIPAFVLDFEQDGRFHPTFTVGLAVWLWMGSFAIAPIFHFLRTENAGTR